MNRAIAIAAAAALLSTFSLLPAAPAVAAPALPCTSGIPLAGDYDGDGHADQLIGVTTGTQSGQRPAFQVTLSNGSAPSLYRDSQDASNADLNGDTCGDVVFNRNPDGYSTQPMLMFGGPNGLDPLSSRALAVPEASPSPDSVVGIRHDGISQVMTTGHSVLDSSRPLLNVFTLDAKGVPGTPQVIDLGALGSKWGVTLAASGRTVAVGAPYLTVGGKTSAGGVFMFSADASAPATLTYRTTLTQSSRGVPGKAESRDFFGISLSLRDGRLAIGSEESIGKVRSTGSVQPIFWHEATSSYTAYRAIHQGTRGVPGSNRTDDIFGYKVVVTRGLTATGSYDIAIAAQEILGKPKNAGSVVVANFSKAIYRGYTQKTKGVPGTVESYDGFGGGIGVLQTPANIDTLLIGAPSERSGASNPGYVIRSNGKRLASSTWTLVSPPKSPTITFTRWGQFFAGQGNPLESPFVR